MGIKTDGEKQTKLTSRARNKKKKRTNINDEEYRKRHGDGKIPGMRYMLDKKQRILRHCCEPMSNDVFHSMAF